MLDKIKSSKYKELLIDQFSKFEDIKFTGQVIFGIIVLLIFWSGARAIESNFKLQKQITNLNEQNNVINLQNNNIALQNEYYKSNQYIELQARQNLGLAFPGETELIVPSSVALKYIVNVNNTQNNSVSHLNSQNNIADWINFFWHRN